MNRRRFLSWFGFAPLCVTPAIASLSKVVIGAAIHQPDDVLIFDELHEFSGGDLDRWRAGGALPPGLVRIHWVNSHFDYSHATRPYAGSPYFTGPM